MGFPAIIDSHCHLDFEDYSDALPEVLGRARDAGIVSMICIGAGRDLSSARGAMALAARETDIWATVGIHPHDTAGMSEPDWETLDGMVGGDRVVGIGETGLDYHYDHSPRDVQGQVFRRFIALARRARLPIVSHIRDAHADAQTILREESADEVGGVIHCFTGNVDDARGYLDMGQHLSFSGILTFKNAAAIREAARFAPLDRILVETDAPYLAPVPFRGKRNEPSYIVETVRRLAEVRGEDIDTVAHATTVNAARLFRLPADTSQQQREEGV